MSVMFVITYDSLPAMTHIRVRRDKYKIAILKHNPLKSPSNVVMLELPSLYEYYVGNEINSGLTDYKGAFFLNGREFQINGGSMDYFRVHPAYWQNRIRKMKAAGLNTVTTNVPWNLHEPSPGVFEFGNGDGCFSKFLNIKEFLQVVQNEDMFAIVRPGPYIGADVDFGGLPSWLLREKGIKIRTNDNKFIEPVRRYFNVLFTVLTALQFTKGGPIIAFEVETGDHLKSSVAAEDYTTTFKRIYDDNNIVEMRFSSNLHLLTFSTKPMGIIRALKVNTSNSQNLQNLQLQKAKPVFVIEYQSGFSKLWGEIHSTLSPFNFAKGLYEIIMQNVSFNIHMFHGGSNFGSISSARITSSYDNDAPISESGDYTEKYFLTKSILSVFKKMPVKIPERPKFSLYTVHSACNVDRQVRLYDLLDDAIQPIYKSSNGPVPMEILSINKNSGFIVYRTKNINITAGINITINGPFHDLIIILVNGKTTSNLIDYGNSLGYMHFTLISNENEDISNATIDIIIENLGRSQNIDELDFQYKGLWGGNVTINDDEILEWDIYSLDFNKTFLNNISKWDLPTDQEGWPTFNACKFKTNRLLDSFLDMRKWPKGVVVVNDFVLSRYFKDGPQQTVYLPAPLLKKDWNDMLIFELFNPQPLVEFLPYPIFNLVE